MCPAPSMTAASYSSLGTLMKNCRSRKMMNADAMNGTVSAGRLFIHEPQGMICPRMRSRLGMKVTVPGIMRVASSTMKMALRRERMRAKA